MEILFLRDDDIPQYVEQGVADIGILGENEVWEKEKDVSVIEKLGFGNCRLSLAIPKDEQYTGLDYFEGKRIATSYPRILSNFFVKKGINVKIEEIGGSVEIATGIGLADGIFRYREYREHSSDERTKRSGNHSQKRSRAHCQQQPFARKNRTAR